MAYDGTITINTKLDTKESASSLKKLSSTIESTLGVGASIMRQNAGQLEKVWKGVFTSIGDNLTTVFSSGTKFSSFINPLSEGLNIATIAQQGFSAAMKASPLATFEIGLAGVTAAASVLTGIISQVIAGIEAEDEVLQNRKAADARIAAVKEETAAYNERRRAQQESVDANLAEISHVQGLAKELEGLVGADGKVEEKNQAKVKFILNELNPALDTEITMIDGQIEGYQTLQGEIDKLVEKKRAEVMLSAYEETYTEAIKNRMNAYREAGEAQLAYEQEVAEIEKLKAENAAAMDTINKYETGDPATQRKLLSQYQAVQDQPWYKEYMERLEALKKEEQAYLDKSAVVDRCNQDIATYEAAQTAMLAGETQKCQDILNTQTFAYQETAIAAGATDEERRQQLGQSYAEYLATMQEYLKKCAADENLYNEAEFREMQEHAARLRTAAEESGAAVGEGKIEGLNGQEIPLNEAMLKLDEGVLEVQAAQAERYKAMGQETPKAYGQGAAESAGEIPNQVNPAMDEANSKIVDNAKTELANEVAVADFDEPGEKIATEVAGGYDEKSGELTDAVETSVDDIHQAAEDKVKVTAFESIGQAIAAKIAAGIRLGTAEMEAAVKTVVQNAMAAAGLANGPGAGDGGSKLPKPKPEASSFGGGGDGAPLAASSTGYSLPRLPAVSPNEAPGLVAKMRAGVELAHAQFSMGISRPRWEGRPSGSQPALAAAGDGGMKVGAIHVSIDAKNVKEFNDVVKVAQRAVVSYRQGYVDH